MADCSRRSPSERTRRTRLHRMPLPSAEPLESRTLLAAGELLLDINLDTLPSHPDGFGAGAGGLVYFTAEAPATGRELYKTDGTPAGTSLVRDIRPGPASAFPSPEPGQADPPPGPDFTAAGSLTFFVANEGSTPRLWRTDGTAAGTLPVASGIVSYPVHLTAVGNVLYFAAWGAGGMQLWRSDGTNAGTRAVSNIPNPTSAGGADIDGLTVSGAKVYFAATDAQNGRALWASDGTPGGTVRVSDPATGGGSPENLFDAGGGTLYFSALDNTTFRRTLWKTTGTAASTARVADVQVDPDAPLARLGTFVYFGSAEPGRPLYRTDGTAAGTTRVEGANRTTLVGVRELVPMGSFLYASAATVGNPAVVLYRTDGTLFGTSLVAPPPSPLAAYEPFGLTVANGRLFFAASPDFDTDSANLYVTNGQPPGAPGGPHTTLVQRLPDDLREGGADWRTVLGTSLVYHGTDRAGGAEPWAADGVAAPLRLKDINTDGQGQPFDDPAVLGNRMYFMADDGAHGRELWSTDGTPAGTRLVVDSHPGETSSGFNALTAYNGRLYFLNYSFDRPWALWSTDGTAAGTRQDVDLNALGLFRPYQMTVYNGSLYFVTTGNQPVDGRYRFQLWKSNGTTAGTVKVRDIDTYAAQSPEHDFTVAGGLLYFTISGGGGREAAVWRTDGTTEGTIKLVEFPFADHAFEFVEADGKVFFSGGGPGTSRELWVTDGTIPGTRVVAPDVINPAGGTVPQQLTEFRGRLFFAGLTGTGIGLWETDGTPEGTRLADVPGYTLSDLFNYNDRLYFLSRNPQNQSVLTKTDGTAAGTEQVFTRAGWTGSGSQFMFEINDMLLFRVQGNPTHWYVSDGTTAGTSEVTGNYNAAFDPVQVGTRALFTADSPGKGIEWWRTSVPDTARPQASWARLLSLPGGGHGVRVVFTEDVAASLARTDLTLIDLGTGGAVSSAFSAVSFDPATNAATFTVSPTRFPGGRLPPGRYRVSMAGGAVADAAGNASNAPFQSEFTVAPPSSVAGRHVFYNRSSRDGNDAAADARDDAAIAGDKRALLPGGAATFGNVTGYTRGINGIMVDIAGLPGPVGAADFSFRATGGTAPAPTAVTVRRGAGAGGSDRVTIVWANSGLRNAWLEVTVRANERTGLAAPDVFSFGNLIGDTGGPGAPAVDAGDVLRTRLHLGRPDAAALDLYDFNRDGAIDAHDLSTVRTSQRRRLSLPNAQFPAQAVVQSPPTRPAARPGRRGILDDTDAVL